MIMKSIMINLCSNQSIIGFVYEPSDVPCIEVVEALTHNDDEMLPDRRIEYCIW